MRITLRLAGVGAAVVLGASPGLALTINPIFDSSVTSQSNAGDIEGGVEQAAAALGGMFSNPVTVNVGISWGNVGGQGLPSSALGASETSLYGYFSYGQMQSFLAGSASTGADTAAYATLPGSAPAGQSRYVLTSAQAKAMGLVDPQAGLDGRIGFGANSYSPNPASVAPGSYDFVAVAEHELTEVMGRISGLSSASPGYATALDLFRYSAPGVASWSYGSPAYFSTDGGATDLADFNSVPGGDKGDWASAWWTNDAADAFLNPGVPGVLSTLDQNVLDVIGWGSTGVGSGGLSAVPVANGAAMAVPEPSALALVITGLGAGLGWTAMGRRRVRSGKAP